MFVEKKISKVSKVVRGPPLREEMLKGFCGARLALSIIDGYNISKTLVSTWNYKKKGTCCYHLLKDNTYLIPWNKVLLLEPMPGTYINSDP